MIEGLTEAENAVAEALACHWNMRRSGGLVELQPRDFADDARIAVAAAQPFLAGDALPVSSRPAAEVPVAFEPTTEATAAEHAVSVTAGTYFDQPWIYLTCCCGWRLGFSSQEDLRELDRAAAVHVGETALPDDLQNFVDELGERHEEDCSYFALDDEPCPLLVTYARYTTNRVAS